MCTISGSEDTPCLFGRHRFMAMYRLVLFFPNPIFLSSTRLYSRRDLFSNLMYRCLSRMYQPVSLALACIGNIL